MPASRTLKLDIDIDASQVARSYAAVQTALDDLDDGRRDGFPHNAVAHPLLVLCPPLGRWLHAHTEPLVPTWRTRWANTLDRVIPAASLGEWHRW